MGKIILTLANGKKVKMSEFRFKMFGPKKNLYDCTDSIYGSFERDWHLKFDKDVVAVDFEDCSFDGIFEVVGKDNQNFNFKNCSFDSHFYTVGKDNDNLYFENCKFSKDFCGNANSIKISSSWFSRDVNIASNFCHMSNNIYNSIRRLIVDSKNISLIGLGNDQTECKIGICEFVGNNISIENCFIEYTTLETSSDTIDIKNSSLVGNGFLDFAADHFLIDNDSMLESYSIRFYNKTNGNLVRRYSNPLQSVVVLGEELLGGKTEAICSMISVLKGISKKIDGINNQEKQEFNKKLDLILNHKKQELSKKIEQLEEKRAQLATDIYIQKDKNDKEIDKRLIREVPYK